LEKEERKVLDLVGLGLVAILSIAGGIAVLVLSNVAARAADELEAWTGPSFEQAIRDHLELRRRNAHLRVETRTLDRLGDSPAAHARTAALAG
jgi:hypothetical protein